MSLVRLFMWTCNICGEQASKSGYGLPSNWEWYGNTVLEPDVKHRCPECIAVRDARLTSQEYSKFKTASQQEIDNRHTSLRQGQYLWSLFEQAHPRIAQALSGGAGDCFYSDEKISSFWKALESKIKG